MSRIITKQKARLGIAIIVDGKDEKWYLERVKDHYQEVCPILRGVKIKPELAQKKKVKQLFELAKEKLDEGYSDVILIIDMDKPLQEKGEFDIFQNMYSFYCKIKSGGNLPPRSKNKYGWMSNLLLIVNNPCLEYWFLLHFQKTTTYYRDFSALKLDLVKIPQLKDYDKSEDYYNGTPDIFNRVGGFNGLEKARLNAKSFDFPQAKNEGISEMNIIFDFLDEKNRR